MADNIDVTPGTGKTVAADEIAGALHQRVKITVGADGTNDGDVSSANPLPITDSANEALLTTIDADTSSIATDAGTIAGDTTSIDGKITACNTGAVTVAASALPSGASTEATLSTLNGKVTACNTVAVVLAAGSAAIGKLAANSGVDIGDVDVTSCALPTGAATSAKQDTLIGHVDGIETVLGTIDADTGAIKTAVETIDNAIDGTEMQVDVVGSLPAGTNAIGKLAANSGVDIGDVDVLSLPALAGSIGNGAKVVTNAGTAEALAGSTACKKVIICAKDSNTGKIYYGGASVSATSGAFIYPGASVEIDISNLSAVYIDSAVNGEGVQYTYVA